MRTAKVLLNNLDKVKKFTHDAELLDCNLVVGSDNIHIDATSILGIFSLDLRDPLDLYIPSDNYEEVTTALAKYIV